MAGIQTIDILKFLHEHTHDKSVVITKHKKTITFICTECSCRLTASASKEVAEGLQRAVESIKSLIA